MVLNGQDRKGLVEMVEVVLLKIQMGQQELQTQAVAAAVVVVLVDLAVRV